MYIVCYFDKDKNENIWEIVSGEDVMNVRVDELVNMGIPTDELMVFDKKDEL